MFNALKQENFLALAKNNQYVCVYKELIADTFTPMSTIECLVTTGETAMLLESALKFHESGSYSFIGIEPYATFLTKNGVTNITVDGNTKSLTGDPLVLLREFQHHYHPAVDTHGKLAGHMLGFLAYDAIRYVEQLPNRHKDDTAIPDILFHFFRKYLVFNHDTNKLLVAVITPTNADAVQHYAHAQAEIDRMIQLLRTSSPSISIPASVDAALDDGVFQTDCDDAAFREKVRQAKAYIQAGDAFQIVISRTFSRPITTSPLAIYRMLRYNNPTPYMFYLTTPAFTLLGASPEKVVSIQDRVVTIAPIAGTAPVADKADAELLAQLRDDPKQRAEHMMLVDLARNDIGAVCEPGSVHVSELMQGERLTYVMHLVSYVKGKLATQYDAFDVLKTVFPAGTLSGAPKIGAMEIIDELENSKRHLYGGAICKVDGEGNLDSCIIIRSGLVKDDVVYVRAGGGIVYDSDPQDEADETRHKARGVFRAIIAAERGTLC